MDDFDKYNLDNAKLMSDMYLQNIEVGLSASAAEAAQFETIPKEEAVALESLKQIDELYKGGKTEIARHALNKMSDTQFISMLKGATEGEKGKLNIHNDLRQIVVDRLKAIETLPERTSFSFARLFSGVRAQLFERATAANALQKLMIAPPLSQGTISPKITMLAKEPDTEMPLTRSRSTAVISESSGTPTPFTQAALKTSEPPKTAAQLSPPAGSIARPSTEESDKSKTPTPSPKEATPSPVKREASSSSLSSLESLSRKSSDSGSSTSSLESLSQTPSSISTGSKSSSSSSNVGSVSIQQTTAKKTAEVATSSFMDKLKVESDKAAETKGAKTKKASPQEEAKRKREETATKFFNDLAVKTSTSKAEGTNAKIVETIAKETGDITFAGTWALLLQGRDTKGCQFEKKADGSYELTSPQDTVGELPVTGSPKMKFSKKVTFKFNKTPPSVEISGAKLSVLFSTKDLRKMELKDGRLGIEAESTSKEFSIKTLLKWDKADTNVETTKKVKWK